MLRSHRFVSCGKTARHCPDSIYRKHPVKYFQSRFSGGKLFLSRYDSSCGFVHVGGGRLQLARCIRGCDRDINVKRLGRRFGDRDIGARMVEATASRSDRF
jgi:hypothetical protein